MHALSDQFLLLDRMRKTVHVKHEELAGAAGMTTFRYLKLLFRREVPRKTEIARLERALTDFPVSASRRIEPSEVRRAGTAAAHRNGLTSDPAHIRGLRIAPPPANSGEGGRG